MDTITLTSEIKETINLDEMSPDELRKVVKCLWHKVQLLSDKIDLECWRYTPINTKHFPGYLTSAK